MGKPDLRTADSFEELKSFPPEELKAEKERIDDRLTQLNRTLHRTEERLRARKEDQEDNSNVATADYVGQGWQSEREQGFQNAKKALSETKRAQKKDLQERKAVINRVLTCWKRGQIQLPTDPTGDGELTDEEERTIAIGKWLLRGNAETSDFRDSIGNFKQEAGQVIGREGEAMSPTTVYNTLRTTGCWHDNPKKGDSSGLEEILQRTKEFAKRHGRDVELKTGVENQ